MIRLAQAAEESLSLREALQECADGTALTGDELAVELAQWGKLQDELNARGQVPSAEAYAERYRVSELEAEHRFVEFQNATGMTPLALADLQWEAASRPRSGGSLLDEVRVVIEN
jgi:hypothetical protein